MITAKGTGFLAVAIIAFLAARTTLVGWLYLVDAVLWGILILSAVLPWLAVLFLDAQRQVVRPNASSTGAGISEGDQLLIGVTLRNRVFVPRFLFNLLYECPLAEPSGRLIRFFVAHLPASGRVNLETTVEAYKRGLHHLGPVVLESSAPFGLFRRRIRWDLPKAVLVYPTVFPLRRLALVEGQSGTSAQPRKSLLGMDPVGSRLYVPGDPRRHIHWRNTARMGRPMVKEFEDAKDPNLDLVFDASQVKGEDKETTLEYAIKIVASAADYAVRDLGSVKVWGGHLHGESVGTSEGGSITWPELLRKLALVEDGEGWGPSRALSQLASESSALVVISADDQPAALAIGRLAPVMHRLVVVVLEGFGEQELGGAALDTLDQLHIPLLRCRPGQMEETLHALENSGGGGLGGAGAVIASSPAAAMEKTSSQFQFDEEN